MQRVSIIMPVLNEAETIQPGLLQLQQFRQQGHELIVVDGGSTDKTTDLARHLCDILLDSQAGRGRQMNIGAKVAKGEILLFLHADTQLPARAIAMILEQFEKQNHKVWGRFNIKLSGRHPLLWMIAWLMNVRSQLSGIATGDQAIFVKRDSFQKLNGFAEIPLMEDIRLSRALLAISRPICIQNKATTSSRRWEEKGILRTILLMWYLRLAHFLGKSPVELSRLYSR